MIKHLLFSEKVVDQYRQPESKFIPCLTDLARINVFVGPNNSGKSRLVRNILSYDHNFQEALNQAETSALSKIHDSGVFLNSDPMKSLIQALKGTAESADGINFSGLFWQEITALNHAKKRATAHALFEELTTKHNLNCVSETLLREFRSKLETALSRLYSRSHDVSPPDTHFTSVPRIYIPLLRGLRPLIRPSDMTAAFGSQAQSQMVTLSLSELTKNLFGTQEASAFNKLHDLYKIATERDYPELKEKCKIFTGLSIYWDIMNNLLGSDGQRDQVNKFEEFLSNRFFEGQPIDLTPQKAKPGVLGVKIGERETTDIHNLGDGIQSIIALLYPLYTQINADKFAMIGIEEPENSLHPGLQQVFIDSLSEFPNAQFFITTHSNHFLESIEERDDTAIFRVESNEYQSGNNTKHFSTITGTTYGDFKTLECLGVLNTSVFLSNSTIWVEGPTDRRLFRHYLNIYLRVLPIETKRRIIEDKHYTFVEYGGSNITHFSFLDDDPRPINVDHLCAKMLLIADDDNSEGAKALRISTLADRLGDRFFKLECKELENLCTPNVLTKIVGHYLPEGKSLQIKEEWASYAKKPLGTFLDGKIQKQGLQEHLKKGKTTFKQGNTVSDKSKFCELAIENTESWEDLSDEAKRVTIAIFEFIYRQNFKGEPPTAPAKDS